MHELKRICGVKRVLPKSCTLSGGVSLLHASGSTSERTLGGSKVRVKHAGGFEEDPQKAEEVRSRRQVPVFRC